MIMSNKYVTIDEKERIEQPFLHWEEGTYRVEIWQWFDRHHSKNLVDGLIYVGE